MKIFSLHAKFSSFYGDCFHHTVQYANARIRMVCSKPDSEAPYEASLYDHYGIEKVWFREDLSEEEIRKYISDFQPDVILTSGWMFSKYLHICRWFKAKGGLVVAFSDTQFKGKITQRLRCLLSRWLLHRNISVVWVSGERQRDYARRLGFSADRIWEMNLCASHQRFTVHGIAPGERDRAFIYVGRLVKEKGIDLLIQAYRLYRRQTLEPWPLVIVGSGPMEKLCKTEEGVIFHGFIQPNDLPRTMSNATCFILPSRDEPWGVVLQEAAACGLPLIASDACGSAVHLLRDGANGFLMETNSVASLLRNMQRLHHLTSSELIEMGKYSQNLASQYSPEIWTNILTRGLRENKRELTT